MTVHKEDIKYIILAVIAFVVVNFFCRWIVFWLLQGHPEFLDLPSWLFGADVPFTESLRLGYLPSGHRTLLFVPAIVTLLSSFLAYFVSHLIADKRGFEKVHMSVAVIWFIILAAGIWMLFTSSTHDAYNPILLVKSILVPEIAVFLGWIIKRQYATSR